MGKTWVFWGKKHMYVNSQQKKMISFSYTVGSDIAKQKGEQLVAWAQMRNVN